MNYHSPNIIFDFYIYAICFQFLRKIHRQERVVDEIKFVLKPHYNKKHITKDDYKDILRRAVPKVIHTIQINAHNLN